MFFKRNRDSEFYVVDCQLCGVTGLQGEAINTHKFGKKHQKKMSNLPIMTKNRQGKKKTKNLNENIFYETL